MTEMTYDEMLSKAKEVFGEDSEVSFVDHQWIIATGIQEKVDLTPFEGTAAFEAYNRYEANYGSDLERWMSKNGHYGSSIAEGMQAYNEHNEEQWKESITLVRAWIEQGKEFDWEGGPEYRDSILKVAEENGW
jgi:hypothetical protein